MINSEQNCQKFSIIPVFAVLLKSIPQVHIMFTGHVVIGIPVTVQTRVAKKVFLNMLYVK